MNLMQKNKSGKVFRRSAVMAAFAMASVTIGSSQAFAAIVCNSPAISVPETTNGVYANFVTAATNTTANVPGWDFNPWASGGELRFFSSTSAANTTRMVGTGNVVDVLPSGTMIDGTSVLATSGIVQPGAFLGGVTNGYVGVVFNNEGTATTNFGWASMTTTAGDGFPATFNQYCYEDSGAGIMAGTTPVSLQSYSID